MPAILPSIPIESDRAARRYFLPYQSAWIEDKARKCLAEKSVRIGWTYAEAFRAVRSRIASTKQRDYLFATKDQFTADEFVLTCGKFAQIFNLTKSILCTESTVEKFQIYDGDQATGFTEEVKIGMIKFDNGSRIIAFSANPNAMRAFGGDVSLDEFAFHARAQELWATASGRITWGYEFRVWSSHNGDSTLFNEIVTEAKAGKGDWSYYRVTMPDAVELGLARKIEETSGVKLTDQEFLAQKRADARTEEAWQQEYMCNPQGSTDAIAPWSVILKNQDTYTIDRLHFPHDRITQQFGEYDPATAAQRRSQIFAFLSSALSAVTQHPQHYRLGFDVACTGQGDLGCFWLDSKQGEELRLRTLITTRTSDWAFIADVLDWFMLRVPAIRAGGDKTGLGQQICWTAEKHYPGQFVGYNFSSDKHTMGSLLMDQVSRLGKRIPKDHPDIAADIYAIKKTLAGNKWKFTEGRNPHLPESHCDIAWSAAIASYTDQQNSGVGAFTCED